MEDLSKYTPIELNKMINDVKLKHDTLKQEVINITYDIDILEKMVNQKLEIIEELEKNYIALIEEMTNR